MKAKFQDWQGVMSGGLRPPILKFSFQNPFPVTENDIIHCVLILQGGYVLGVSSGLATDPGGSDPGGVMSGGFMSANQTYGH